MGPVRRECVLTIRPGQSRVWSDGVDEMVVEDGARCRESIPMRSLDPLVAITPQRGCGQRVKRNDDGLHCESTSLRTKRKSRKETTE